MELGALTQAANSEYRRYTEQTSTITRSLALAGVALVWLYRSQDSGATALPTFTQTLIGAPILLITLAIFVASLGADLIQYALSAYKWLRFKHTLSRIADSDDFSAQQPTGRALSAWSNRYGLDLAQSLAYQASTSPNVNALFSSPAASNDILVWRARKILHSPAQVGLSDEEAKQIREHLFVPSHVTSGTNALFWIKVALTATGYLVLLLSLVLEIVGKD